jgi:hypothetical protein
VLPLDGGQFPLYNPVAGAGTANMPTKIYLGLHGARAVGEDHTDSSPGNRVLDEMGRQLGCPVYDFPAATHPDPDSLSPVSGKPTQPGFVTTKAVGYLVRRIEEAGDPSPSIRLFGWSTGAIMLCRVAEDLKTWSRLGHNRPGKIDLCFAIDPLWSLAAINYYPKIPANVRRWACVRQNRNDDRPPTFSPFDKKFWQGVRLRTASHKTQYDEINVATGNVIGQPGFVLPTNPKVVHGDMPVFAVRVALQLLRA